MSDDKKWRISAFSLIDLIECGTIKCDNFCVSKILVDQLGGRLLAATREGCLLFFDITAGMIQLIYQKRNIYFNFPIIFHQFHQQILHVILIKSINLD